jgi:hypothetical protein
MTTRPDDRTDQDQLRTGTEHGDSRRTEADPEYNRAEGGHADPGRVDPQSYSRKGEQAEPGRVDSPSNQRQGEYAEPGEANAGTDAPAETVSSMSAGRSTDHEDSAQRHPNADTAGGGETSGPDGEERERLIPQKRTDEYIARWDTLKGGFVDEPRQAVAEADQLVRELLDELQEVFRTQRQGLEQGLDADQTSTEDLRVALRRYRSLFDRLLSV